MRNEKGQYVKKYEINKNFFFEKNKEFYYFLGLMASDGNIKNNSVFSITQSNTVGKQLIEFILKILNPFFSSNVLISCPKEEMKKNKNKKSTGLKQLFFIFFC